MIPITIDTALVTFSNFQGYSGDQPKTEEEYNALVADSNRAMLGLDSVFDGEAPTWDEVQAKLAELQAADPASAGNQKLLDLGLTQEEATALTGYVPPSE
jgi:hypothetical protein